MKLTAEASGEWLIEKIVQAGAQFGAPITDEERSFLRKPIWDLDEDDRPTMLALTNKVVSLVRSAIEAEKRNGATTVRVRWGHRIPADWVQHYGTIYSQELPWVLSGILQNAMLQNPFQGETKKWKSP